MTSQVSMAKPSRMSAGKEESSAFTYDTLVYPWNSPIPIVTVEGDSTEMGKQFGSATKETIQKIVSFNMPTLEKILEKSQIKKKDYLKNAESVLEKFGMSSYLDEIKSMSEAAGVPYQSLLLVNTNIDILYNLPKRLSSRHYPVVFPSWVLCNRMVLWRRFHYCRPVRCRSEAPVDARFIWHREETLDGVLAARRKLPQVSEQEPARYSILPRL